MIVCIINLESFPFSLVAFSFDIQYQQILGKHCLRFSEVHAAPFARFLLSGVERKDTYVSHLKLNKCGSYYQLVIVSDQLDGSQS